MSESKEVKERAPHPDKPSFDEFCVLFCKSEVIRIEQYQQQLKEAKRTMHKLRKEFEKPKTDVQALADKHPFIAEAYDKLDEELYAVEEQYEANRERFKKAQAMENAIANLELSGDQDIDEPTTTEQETSNNSHEPKDTDEFETN